LNLVTIRLREGGSLNGDIPSLAERLMLTIEEEDMVTDALLQVVRPSSDARATLITRMENRLADRLEGGARCAVIAHAIRLCTDDGYASIPPALVRLLGLVHDLNPKIPPLIERLSNPLPGGGPATDPFLANVLFTKLPFLERAATRTALRALLQVTPGQPFVVVNGLCKLGKSYTADFISHVLLGRTDPMPCLISMPPHGGVAVGPSELARDLVARMGGDLTTEPPKNTNLDRWYEELVSWITAPGLKDGVIWWIILDGFNRAELRDDTRQLIAKIAVRFTNAKPQRFFRLILLDFDHTSLPVTPGLISVDVIQPIPKASVQTFLTGMFSGAERLNVPAISAEVTAGLSEPIVELPVLAERLGTLIREATA
jgi:hypothetical protein